MLPMEFSRQENDPIYYYHVPWCNSGRVELKDQESIWQLSAHSAVAAENPTATCGRGNDVTSRCTVRFALT